jgi:hypothetical protein
MRGHGAQAMSTPQIAGGLYTVILVCPSCGEVGAIPATLATRLVMVRGESATLGLRVKAAKLPHSCGQLTITAALEELEPPPSEDRP